MIHRESISLLLTVRYVMRKHAVCTTSIGMEHGVKRTVLRWDLLRLELLVPQRFGMAHRRVVYVFRMLFLRMVLRHCGLLEILPDLRPIQKFTGMASM